MKIKTIEEYTKHMLELVKKEIITDDEYNKEIARIKNVMPEMDWKKLKKFPVSDYTNILDYGLGQWMEGYDEHKSDVRYVPYVFCIVGLVVGIIIGYVI